MTELEVLELLMEIFLQGFRESRNGRGFVHRSIQILEERIKAELLAEQEPKPNPEPNPEPKKGPVSVAL